MEEYFKKPVSPESSDDDDDDESEDRPTTKRIPRRVPGVILSAGKQAEAAPKVIKSRLPEGLLTKKEEPVEEDQKTPEPADAETTLEGTIEPQQEAQKSDEDVVNEWEDEGEFSDQAEIQLNRSSPIAETSPDAEDDAGEATEAPPRAVSGGGDERSKEEKIPDVVEDTAEAEPTEEEPMHTTGSGGNLPPEPPETSSDSPEEEPDEPAATARPTASHSYGSGFSAPPTTTRVEIEDAAVRQRELDDAEYYGRRSGVRSGVVAGFVAGRLTARHKRKKEAAKFENKLDEKDKEIGKLTAEQFTAKERLDSIKRNSEKIEASLASRPETPAQQLSKQEKPVYRPAPIESARPELQPTSSAKNERPETYTKPAEHLAERPEAAANKFEAPAINLGTGFEKTRPEVSEKAAVSSAEKPVSFEISAELPPEEREITEETYQKPEGRRVESSSWHRIEMDEKTGRAVENPKVAYGEEFRRETKREVLRDNHHGAVSSAAQLGGVATTPIREGGVVAPTPFYTSSSPAASHNEPKQPIQTSDNQLVKYAQSPAVWAAGIFIVVVLLIIGLTR